MSKIRIREGNDFDVVWAITRAGQPEDLSTAINMKLTLVVYGLVIEHSLFTVADNLLSINIPKEVATVNGDYRLVFEYTLPDAGQPDGDLKCKTDVVPFRIVPFTAQADDVYTLNTSSDVLLGFKGDKGEDGDDAYQIWLDLGNVGTYEDFIVYLRQPAVDAGASISELELIIEGNESGRVTAEGERDAAETLREQAETLRAAAESGRATAEGLRDGAEVLRIAAEGVRDDNEGDRIIAESDRADAEELREGAELLRETAESERIAAEILREANIQDAIDAAALANTKAGLANTAATAANTATGLADAATIAANTAAGNAQDVADTVDGRVTAVEGDLVQLAGDVSELELKDVVQSDKIKDIENVISTMNPNQSAQLSVSGVSPLSLPKNAANSGMSVKLEGLTEDVGGVITHFGPTGRVRSMGKNIVREQALQSGVGINLSTIYIWAKLSVARSIDYIEISPNTTYRISGLNLNRLRIAYYDEDYVFISGVDNDTVTYTTRTFGPTPSNANYMRLTIAVSAEPSNVMIEKDTGVTSSYEPYRDTKLYLTAPELRSNGTVKDEVRKGANGYELVKRISDIDGTVLATPVISPISYGGILNSAENGTVYHEPIIADAGVYGTNLPIFNPDYPIASIEEIIKHEGGVDTYLNASTAVIAPDGLSFTHPDLENGDLVLFTYSFDKESTNGQLTATFYDSNVVKIDTVTGKAYKITDVVTNGVLTRTLTEV